MENNRFHECRYVMHLKEYDAGINFYREVLGLQPNFNWAIVPNNKGYRFYMGNGRLEIVQYPFDAKQGKSEMRVECKNLALCMDRILEEMPEVKIVSRSEAEVILYDANGNLIHLLQGTGDNLATGAVEKTNMFTGNFTGIFYEDDMTAAKEFYCGKLGLTVAAEDAESILLKAGDAYLELRAKETATDTSFGPSMIALEADSVNKYYDMFSVMPDYKEVFCLHDTDFDARRFFQMLDPSGNVVEIYAYLRNVREEILLH